MLFLLVVVILIVILVMVSNKKATVSKDGFLNSGNNNNNNNNNNIWTCTTFFDFPKKDKWAAFQNCMDSFLQYNTHQERGLISKWIVINEYSANPKNDWASLMKSKFPFIEFIQKTKEQEGQAKGLNMILNRIKPYKYWFHWEEAWNTRAPLISRAIAIMDSNQDITQLQMTAEYDRPANWLDVESNRIHCTDDICRIDPHKNTPMFINKNPDHMTISELRIYDKFWPLYSLRPSINRVSFYVNNGIGNFPEKKELWPYLFELHYAIRWLKAGAIKAIFKTSPVERQINHISTYHI